jgi:hypothetical protein
MMGNDPDFKPLTDRDIILHHAEPVDVGDCIHEFARRRWEADVAPNDDQEARLYLLQRRLEPAAYDPREVLRMIEQVGLAFDEDEDSAGTGDHAFRALGAACAWTAAVATRCGLFVAPLLYGAERYSKETGGTHPIGSFGWLAKAALAPMEEHCQRKHLAIQLSTALAHAMDSVLINWVEPGKFSTISLSALCLIVGPEVLPLRDGLP